MGPIGQVINEQSGEVLVEMFGPPQPEGREDLGGALYSLSECLARGFETEGMHGGLAGAYSWGVEFENDVFLMHPDYQDAECDCGFRKLADDWHEAHRHKGTCYSVVVYRLRRAWEHANGDKACLSRRFDRVMKRLCKLREIPWDNGRGCLVHCDCGVDGLCREFFSTHGHEFRCPHRLPNFWHKDSGLEVRWYKSIGRDMKILPEGVSIDIVRTAIRESFESIPEEVRNKAQESHESEHTPEAKAAQEESFAIGCEAMDAVFASLKPCWRCSEAGGRSYEGGSWGGEISYVSGKCIAKTLHDDCGACRNCGHINTERQMARLAERESARLKSWATFAA
jgi:hypothetical protein